MRKIAAILALSCWCLACSGSGDGEPDATGADGGADAGMEAEVQADNPTEAPLEGLAEVQDLPIEAQTDVTPDVWGEESADPGAETLPETTEPAGEIAEPAPDSDDESGDVELPPFPPVPPAPPVAAYDCTHDPSKLPGRVSPVPLTCPIDPDCVQPMVVGHRSTGAELGPIAPENSLAAMRAAIVSGLDGVEMDVQDTKDGKLVVLHDGDVDTTLQGTGKVSELTLAEIQAMPFRLDKVSVAGDFSCERAAAFEVALDLVKDRLFVDLDLKTGRVDLVVPIVRDKGMLDQVFFSSTSLERLQAVRAIEPKARIQVRPDTTPELEAAVDGLDPDPDIFELPEWPNAFTVGAPPAIHALGRKAFSNSFVLDLQSYLTSEPGLFLDAYEGGIDILQSDMPTLVVKALGRFPF